MIYERLSEPNHTITHYSRTVCFDAPFNSKYRSIAARALFASQHSRLFRMSHLARAFFFSFLFSSSICVRLLRNFHHPQTRTHTHAYSCAHTYWRALLCRNDTEHMHKSTTIQRIFSMCMPYMYLSYAWRIISSCSAASQQHKLNIRAIHTHTHTKHKTCAHTNSHRVHSLHLIRLLSNFPLPRARAIFSFFSVSAHSLTCVLFIIIFTTYTRAKGRPKFICDTVKWTRQRYKTEEKWEKKKTKTTTANTNKYEGTRDV